MFRRRLVHGGPERHPVAPGEDVRCSVALPVILVEELGVHCSFGIDNQRNRNRYSVGHIAFGDGFVEYAECANNLRIRIGEQRESNIAPLREIRQHRLAVIADRRQPEAILPKRLLALFQLDQLAFTVRSPVRGPVENENGPVRTGYRGKPPHRAVLVNCLELGDAGSNGRPGVFRRL